MINLNANHEDLVLDLKREIYTYSYFEFFKWVFELLHPTQPYVDTFHIKYLCDILQDEFERVLRREEKGNDYIINVPPRASKSLVTSVALIAWVWIRKPDTKFICISFDNALSNLNSQMSMDVISHPEYQKLFGHIYQLRKDARGKEFYANTRGGQRLSRTTGQNVTGFSGEWILLDDPDSAMSATSEVERKFVHKYYNEALFNRLTPVDLGIRLIIQQRLHEEDLSGYLLNKTPDNYHHICLPAEITKYVKPAQLAEFYRDGLLDPNRLNSKTLTTFRTTLGTGGYTGQYLQRPAPEEGGVFKRAWFEIVDPALTLLQRDVINEPIHFIIDSAYTDKQTNDPTAILACYRKGNYLYVIDVQQKWLEFPELCKFIIEYVNRFQYSQNSKIFIEPKASGKSIVQQLRNSTMLNVVEIPSPKDSKVTRANSITPICESHRVKLVKGSYVDDFMTQVITFPNAAHDDMVDVLVYSIAQLLQNVSIPFVFL